MRKLKLERMQLKKTKPRAREYEIMLMARN